MDRLSIEHDLAGMRFAHAEKGERQFCTAGTQKPGHAQRFAAAQIEGNILEFVGTGKVLHRQNDRLIVVIGSDDGAVEIPAGHQLCHS
ncbi:hypothetical protein D3C73_655720 [compost metagenome]